MLVALKKYRLLSTTRAWFNTFTNMSHLSLSCVPSSAGDIESKRCDASSLVVGDVLSRLSYYRVVNPKADGDRVEMRRVGEDSSLWVPERIVGSEFFDTLATKTVLASRTAIVDWFHRAGDAVFEVSFTKADGSARTLVGHHVGAGGKDTVMGRTIVRELVPDGDGVREQQRQVDSRTISQVTYGGVRAVVGKADPGVRLEDQRRAHLDVSKLRKGMIVSRAAYYRVRGIPGDGFVNLGNLAGKEWPIAKPLLKEECFGVQALHEKAVNATDAALLLMAAGDKVFRVVFEKANGEERTMDAFNTGRASALGRSFVNELYVTDAGSLAVRERQVDHRTIRSLTLGGTRFTVSSGRGKRGRRG